MANNTLKARLIQASKTEAEWKSSNPVLLKGEVAYSSDKKQRKTGDGSSKWTDLEYDKSVPTAHTHDDRYYTESEVNTKLGGKVDLSTDGVSKAINKLSTGTATPTDEDYYISQYTGGGATTTSYHRRPMKALWAYIQSKLHKVATSGSYNDLSNKPTIGNGKVTIKQAGTSKGTFTLNQTDNTTIELTDDNTTYSTGTSTAPGLTKLYTSVGTATDGTMTQAAMKSALDGKAPSSHTHNYAGSSSAGGVANSANKLATPRKINGIAFDGTKDINNVIYTTKKDYDTLVKTGTYDKSAMYVTTDEMDNTSSIDPKLLESSISLAQQGKYLSYSDQNGGKYLSIKNTTDNSTVGHTKLMDGESGEGMDVDEDKVKTIDSKGILVDALGETTAQALIDEVAKRVIDLTGRMSTTETGLQSANEAITSLNSNIPVLRKIWFDDTSASDIKELLKAKCGLIQKNKLGDGLYIITGGWSTQNFGFTIGQKYGGTIRIAFFDFYNIYQATSSTDDSLSNFAATSVKFTTI